jgi:hypothetical protein
MAPSRRRRAVPPQLRPAPRGQQVPGRSVGQWKLSRTHLLRKKHMRGQRGGRSNSAAGTHMEVRALILQAPTGDFTAARTSGDGVVPHHHAERRQHFRPRRGEDAAVRKAWLHCNSARSDELRPRAVEESRKVRPRSLQRSTSHRIDEAKCERIGFARCPFERTTFEVKDGRKAALRPPAFHVVVARASD